MSVSFQTRQSGDSTVVSAIGRIDSSHASEFEAALFEVLDAGPTGGVAVDFSKLDYRNLRESAVEYQVNCVRQGSRAGMDKCALGRWPCNSITDGG